MKAILDKLDKLAPREKLFLVLGIVFAIGYLLDQFVVRSFVRRLKDVDTQIEQKKAVRMDSAYLLAREKDLKAEYEEVGKFITRAASASEAIAAMKGELYEAGKKTGLSIRAMEQRETRSRTSIEEYVVEITKFEAESKDLMNFLYGIETAPGMTRVLKLNVTPGKTRNSVMGSILLAKVMFVDNPDRKPASPSGAEAKAPAAPKKR